MTGMSTYSNHIDLLPARRREGLLDCVTRFGGRITKRYLAELVVAGAS
jgi:hypothetical protein